jgi:acetolactate synthase-1/3 small subunit
VIKNSHANIVTVSPDFFVIEKTGHREVLEELYRELLPYGLKQYVRSGRIAVSKKRNENFRALKRIYLIRKIQE